MIECKKLSAKISESTCIARQKIIEKTNNKGKNGNWGMTGATWLKVEQCEGCKTGLKYYEESKNKPKETKPMSDKKTCEKCKKTFPKDRNHFDYAAGSPDKLTKACRICRGTRTEMPAPRKIAVPTDEIYCGPKPKEKTEQKTCAWPDCGKVFTRRPEETPVGWRNRKYCCDDCAKKADYKKDIERKKELRRRRADFKNFDPDEAGSIAREVTEEVLSIITLFVKDHDQLEQMRGIAEKVGIECQKRMIEAA